jgi:hypothetical protein
MTTNIWRVEILIEEHLGIHDHVAYNAHSLVEDLKEGWFPPRINLKLKELKVGLVEVKES